jgi:hypothetical protein
MTIRNASPAGKYIGGCAEVQFGELLLPGVGQQAQFLNADGVRLVVVRLRLTNV